MPDVGVGWARGGGEPVPMEIQALKADSVGASGSPSLGTDATSEAEQLCRESVPLQSRIF